MRRERKINAQGISTPQWLMAAAAFAMRENDEILITQQTLQ